MISGCRKKRNTNELKGPEILSMDGLEAVNNLPNRKRDQEFQNTPSLSKLSHVDMCMEGQDVPVAAKYQEPFAEVLHDGTIDQAVDNKETDICTDISNKGSLVGHLEHEIRERINSAVVKLTEEMRQRLEEIGNKTN